MKHKTSYALSDECNNILSLLKQDMGIAKASIIEVAVRELFTKRKRENLQTSEETSQTP